MVSLQFSEFANKIELKSLPTHVVAAAKNCLLDFCGAAIAGHDLRGARIIIDYVKSLQGQGESSILGTEIKVPAPHAALANGTLASCLDIDDGHRLAVGHPGSMVISAGLAAAEHQNVTGKELLEAIIAGYEIAIRCGCVLNSNYASIFYGSGGWAIYGAAAAAGKLLNLNLEQMRNALGICEVNGPRAQCLKSIANGSMTKESIGWGSMSGLTAAYLARRGFTGPAQVLTDEDFYDSASLKVLDSLGQTYEIANTYFKQYSSCRWSHSPIEAVLLMRSQHGIDYRDIYKIKIRTFNHAASLGHKRPKSSEAAEYSIPFTVVAALVDGEVGPEQVKEARLADTAILKVADLVDVTVDPALEKEYPETRPAIVRIETREGRVYEKKVAVLKGDASQPLTKEELQEKFGSLSAKWLGISGVFKVMDFLEKLETQKEASLLLELMSVGSKKLNY